MKWHEINPGFVCRICHYESENKPSYEEHLELHKGRSRYLCVFCEKKFCGKKRLHRHTQRVVSIDYVSKIRIIAFNGFVNSHTALPN